tara:strand:+ start:1000 stop:1224 length:225 start_codon:yes stop_codon:yes gene_type:complete
MKKESKGNKQAEKLIKTLREKVYPKLSNDDITDFKIMMADHLGLELPSYLKPQKNWFAENMNDDLNNLNALTIK